MLAVGACEREPASAHPPRTVSIPVTGAVRPEVAASQRTAEAWLTLWEGLADSAEQSRGDCDAIAAGWSRQLAGREAAVRELLATSAAEPEPLRRRMAIRYRERVERLIPRIGAIRGQCAGNRAVDAALAALELRGDAAALAHGHAH